MAVYHVEIVTIKKYCVRAETVEEVKTFFGPSDQYLLTQVSAQETMTVQESPRVCLEPKTC
jgi:hypothetical protein